MACRTQSGREAKSRYPPAWSEHVLYYEAAIAAYGLRTIPLLRCINSTTALPTMYNMYCTRRDHDITASIVSSVRSPAFIDVFEQ